jgi:hypothetical protein
MIENFQQLALVEVMSNCALEQLDSPFWPGL